MPRVKGYTKEVVVAEEQDSECQVWLVMNKKKSEWKLKEHYDYHGWGCTIYIYIDMSRHWLRQVIFSR